MNPLASQNRSKGAPVNLGDALQIGSLLLESVENVPSLKVNAYAHCNQALISLFYP
jgi:hypothetical protein